MPDKNLIHILTVLEVIEKIGIYGDNFEDADSLYFANEQMNFNAIANLLLVVGEECGKIEEDLKQEFNEVAWTQVMGLHNRLAHDYRGTDPNIVFDIIRNYLPPLKNALIQMTDILGIEDVVLERILSSNFYKHLHYLKKKE